jgi:hypothetical protein
VKVLDHLQRLAVAGKLYPSVILHGASREERIEAAYRLARALLCEVPEHAPCGVCRHCRRIAPGDELFHPDVHALGRDLKTSTSVAAARELVAAVQLAPFEARGQVFILLEAEALSAEAADSLLKVLEEPPVRAPRHFLLLTPSPRDLLPTLRSRSWSLYLGPAERLAPAEVERLGGVVAEALLAWARSGAGVHLLEVARRLVAAGGEDWKDPRAGKPFAVAAAGLARAAALIDEPELRRRALGGAADLLEAAPLRLRGISAERIVEGVIARRMALGRGGSLV